MPVEDISKQVWRFIAANIDSVPQLEALLLLCEKKGDSWTPGQVASRIYVTEPAAREILGILRERSLVCGDEDSVSFHCSPETHSELIDQVAAAYRRNLVPIATFIHSKVPANAYEFADDCACSNKNC